MENITAQVYALAESADDKTHRELVDTLRHLLYAIERPVETAERLIFGHYPLAVARVAQNTRLVEVLVMNERQPLEVKQIAEETGIAPLLTERILRYMAATGMATQVSDNRFAANKTTEGLHTPVVRAGVGLGMDFASPSAQALPAFLQQNKYKNIDNIDDCPWHPGHHKTMNAMTYLSHPPILAEYNTFMQLRRPNASIWLDVYPLESQDMTSKDRIFFVDIGGGKGQVCTALKGRYPILPREVVVLQDISETITQLPTNQIFDAMVHDYYTEQPVKDARYYYFRSVLHDLTDESCQKVLLQTKVAMAPDSRILVDEVVVPTQGASWRAVHLDILLLSALGAMERTQEQWQKLFSSAGLRISNEYTYDTVQGNAILEVVAIQS